VVAPYRRSVAIGIVYNPFPWPEASNTQRAKVRELAQAVLDARAKFPNATLADLYDTDVMRPELRKAHQALDTTVDKLYRGAAFAGDRDRVEHLFALYEKLVAPHMAAPAPTNRRRRTLPVPGSR
jgi:hypothetical protein